MAKRMLGGRPLRNASFPVIALLDAAALRAFEWRAANPTLVSMPSSNPGAAPAPPSTIAFLGFGEAGQTFAGGWGESPPARIAAFDIKTDDPASRAAKRADYDRLGVKGADTLAQALAEAEVVISVVTAGSATQAARQAAPSLRAGALFVDMNSCSPGAKRASAQAVEAAGGRYLDAAVLSPVKPLALKAPILVAGPHAETGGAVLTGLGFNIRAVKGDVGAAAAIKMIRSVMIKGIEALTAECMLSAYAAGVEDEVLASLQATPAPADWTMRADYNLERMIVHGRRRAEEMVESAATVRELGLGGSMAAATAAWQGRIAALGLAPPDGLSAKAKALIEALQATEAP